MAINKKFKKFLFAIIGIFVSIGAIVGGYFLFVNLAKVTINDLKILDNAGNPINNTSVYLSDQDHNKFVVSPSISTSSGSGAGYFVSSNTAVARVRYENSNYYVEYYKAGQATITLYSHSTNAVKDSFELTVYEDFIQKVTMYQVIDGQQYKYEDNILKVYGNGQINTFGYLSQGMLENSLGNDMLLRVVENYNKEVLSSVELNQSSKELYITTNLTKENSTQTINLQTYYIDDTGEEHIVKNFSYQVNVVGFDIKEIQLIVNNNYDLATSNFLYLNKDYYYYPTDPTEDIAIVGTPPKLATDDIIKEICLTDEIKGFYFKVRVFFTDGTYEEPLGKNVASTFNVNYYKIAVDNLDYCLFTINEEESTPGSSQPKKLYSISYTCQKTVGTRTVSCGQQMSFSFYITYLKADMADADYNKFVNKSLYVARVDNLDNVLYYEYCYWDNRYQRNDEITDINGRIIGFSSGAAPDCKHVPVEG